MQAPKLRNLWIYLRSFFKIKRTGVYSIYHTSSACREHGCCWMWLLLLFLYAFSSSWGNSKCSCSDRSLSIEQFRTSYSAKTVDEISLSLWGLWIDSYLTALLILCSFVSYRVCLCAIRRVHAFLYHTLPRPILFSQTECVSLSFGSAHSAVVFILQLQRVGCTVFMSVYLTWPRVCGSYEVGASSSWWSATRLRCVSESAR